MALAAYRPQITSSSATPTFVGSPPGCPVTLISPDNACTMMSYPGREAVPSRSPNAVSEQYTSWGLAADRLSWSRPNRAINPGRKFSTTTSDERARRRARLRWRSDDRSRTTERLFRFKARKYAASSPTNGGPHARESSPVSGRSTLTTSAPRSASSIVARGPASTREKSATRTPASGREPGGRVWSDTGPNSCGGGERAAPPEPEGSSGATRIQHQREATG